MTIEKREVVGATNWFKDTIRKGKRLHEKALKDGLEAGDFVWASLYLETFLEGVFTMRPLPNVIEVEVPKGLFRLTAIEKDGEIMWIVRNDTFDAICEVSPLTYFEWAVKVYPEGIGNEGYMQIAHSLLTAGCKTKEEKDAVWDGMFYKETQKEGKVQGI